MSTPAPPSGPTDGTPGQPSWGSTPPPPPPQGQPWGQSPPPQGPPQGPPPQGPPAQGQPQGPPPQGQPWGQSPPPPGQPWQQPGQPTAFGDPAAVAAQAKRKRLISIGAAVVAVLVVAGLFFYQRATDPEVGDCLVSNTSSDTVDCSSSDALYRIVGVEDDKISEDDFNADPNTCSEFLDDGAVAAEWYGSRGDDGTVYCLADN